MSLLINMLLKNLINNLPEEKKKLLLQGYPLTVKKLVKEIFFLPLKEIITMEKIILKKQFIEEHL